MGIARFPVVLHDRAVSARSTHPAKSTIDHAQRHRQHDGATGGLDMQSRRNFLSGTLGAGLVMAASQHASTQAPAPQGGRKRLIVDAQVHLWKAESPDWPWVPGMKPQMPEPFTIEK